MIREYLAKDVEEFPEILDWYDKIKNNKDYKIILKEGFYAIVKISKNKICRVEKFDDNIHLNDILNEIDKVISRPQMVIVPSSRQGVLTQFYLNGFDIDKYLKSKYRVGRNCYSMIRK